jgi:hypothetical protein
MHVPELYNAAHATAVQVQFYLAFLAPDQTSYILFLAVCIFFIYIFAVPVLVVFKDPPRGDPYVERRRFIPAFSITIVMIAAISKPIHDSPPH